MVIREDVENVIYIFVRNINTELQQKREPLSCIPATLGVSFHRN